MKNRRKTRKQYDEQKENSEGQKENYKEQRK